jgi:riboflavin kinase/FMN adenylyltransferase
VLVEGIGARLVVVGADFHFGHRRGGNVPLLERMGAELGFEVLGLGLVAVEGEASGVPYSSTRIRELLAKGDVAEAARLLGRPHEVRGVVERGDQRGAEHLGMPTANLTVPERICLPADGVYAGTFVAEDEVERPAAISVGTRPTFYEDGDVLVEAYVLDFDGDLYGRRVKVRFREWVRGQERFDSTEALVEQMNADVEATRRILAV